MINQTVINNDTRVHLTTADSADSGVATSIYDPEGVKVVDGGDAVVEDGGFYYDVDQEILDSYGTFTVEWVYSVSASEKKTRTKLDTLEDTRTRYCYQEDIKEKLFDILLPSTFNLGNYSKRASNEIERALQGLYPVPLVPDTENANYDQDFISLRAMCADIGVSYAMEDISISNTNQAVFSQKKTAAFAELKRYMKEDKVFVSVPKDTDRSSLHYQSDKPRVAASRTRNKRGESQSDPFNEIYNDFSPTSDNV